MFGFVLWLGFTQMLEPKRLAKLIYISGLLSFLASCCAPATPQKMTSSKGDEVELWRSSESTHLQLAFEPVGQVLDYFYTKKNPEGKLFVD